MRKLRWNGCPSTDAMPFCNDILGNNNKRVSSITLLKEDALVFLIIFDGLVVFAILPEKAQNNRKF